jgi:formylglycine-generating enzyme required for sulfatase activity
MSNENLKTQATYVNPNKEPEELLLTVTPLEQLPNLRIGEVIGEGAFGTCYQATQLSLNRHVAVKVLKPEFTNYKRFEQEIKILAKLEHPHIVRIIDRNVLGTLPLYYVMEYVRSKDGTPQTLADAVKKNSEKNFDLNQFKEWIKQVAEALQYAHENGVIHRDIKPANVLINHHGEAKVGDFGISRNTGLDKPSSDKSLSFTGQLFGTAGFIAPEIMDGGIADARSDIYSLGATVYQLLTDEIPKGRYKDVSELNPKCGKEWDDLTNGMLEAEPDDRFQTMAEVIQQLDSIDTAVRVGGLPSKEQPLDFTDSLGIKFKRIEAGEFMMGSPVYEGERCDNEVQHKVKISKPFYMGVYEVTRGQFRKFVNETGYKTDAEKEGKSFGYKDGKYDKYEGMSWRNSGFEQTDEHPVISVSWNDCKAFVDWLNDNRRQVTLPAGYKFALPTEAQWEYACRAGTQTAYSFGNDSTSLSGYAWYWDNSDKTTHPVGTKEPNGWGLYDIHGNVWEWCSDWYGDYPTGSVTDPTGGCSGSCRMGRGGSWGDSAGDCRSADRAGDWPDYRSDGLGCRLSLVLQ